MPSGMVPQAQRGANTPRQMPVENDETNATGILEPSLMLVSISPLRSLESIVELQISGPGTLWSEDILSEFQDLPDFSLAQTNALTALLRSRQLGASVNGNPLGVCNYLLMFQSQIQDLEELRTLAQRLKVLSRTDVIVVMHKQRNLLRWLGPFKPEELLIKDMSISHWLEFTTALSITNPIGNDWRMLANKLDIPRTYLDLWMQQNHNPAEMVLKTFMVRVSEATVGRIFDLMIEMEREDLAAIL
ncbi:uncharacterized protein LOC108700307 [Xenopus laevis]|uniref:Death domain-containing protein n=2 Tax=Xenopus laevis TaxID=8355 RepID=A0A974C4G3_XENLA|nr:uncharacterized protein LOC108700307 [Xenopus laevis]OCT66368.1 hypothetical protein XELAEV_18042624mg [Xenopus laevis]